jgi:hypothetical protein
MFFEPLFIISLVPSLPPLLLVFSELFYASGKELVE